MDLRRLHSFTLAGFTPFSTILIDNIMFSTCNPNVKKPVVYSTTGSINPCEMKVDEFSGATNLLGGTSSDDSSAASIQRQDGVVFVCFLCPNSKLTLELKEGTYFYSVVGVGKCYDATPYFSLAFEATAPAGSA